MLTASVRPLTLSRPAICALGRATVPQRCSTDQEVHDVSSGVGIVRQPAIATFVAALAASFAAALAAFVTALAAFVAAALAAFVAAK